MPGKSKYFQVDAFQERIKAIRVEIVAILRSDAMYQRMAQRSEIYKAAHQVRRQALERIEIELSALAKGNLPSRLE